MKRAGLGIEFMKHLIAFVLNGIPGNLLKAVPYYISVEQSKTSDASHLIAPGRSRHFNSVLEGGVWILNWFVPAYIYQSD